MRTHRILTIGSPEERIRRWPGLADVPIISLSLAVSPPIASGRVLGCIHIGYLEEKDAEQRPAVAGADRCLTDVMEASKRFRRMAAVHADPQVQPLVDELHARYPPSPAADHLDGRLVVSNAGRLPPWWSERMVGPRCWRYRGRRPSVYPPARPGPAVSPASLAPALFLYTDGLIESSRKAIDGELERLRRSLVDTARMPLRELRDRLVDQPLWSGDRPDDVAFLALRRLSTASNPPAEVDLCVRIRRGCAPAD